MKHPVFITTTSLPAGTVGVPYQQTLSATAGEGTLTWSLVSGALPSGMALSGSGILSGTATASGTGNFTVRVADADGDADTQALSITIDSPGGGPVEKFAVGAGDVTASEQQNPNVAANTIDEDPGTRWSAQGDGQWIRYDLGSLKDVQSLEIAWHNGDSRVASYEIEVSDDGATWTSVTGGTVQSSGTTTALEAVDVTDALARYVRIVGHGNTDNSWNSIIEVEIWGATPSPPPVPTNLTPTPGDGQVVLNWTISDGAMLHHLKRSTTSGSGFTTIASGAGGSYLDTSVVNGTTYYYVVSAESAAGERADSVQVSAKPYTPISPDELVAPTLDRSGDNIELSLESVYGRIYQLQRNDTLAPEDWEDVGGPVTGTGTSIILADPDAFLVPKRFYRLQVQP